MSLARRLNLRIAGLFLLLLLAAAVLLIRNARDSVHAEIASTVSLAIQIIDGAAAEVAGATSSELFTDLSKQIKVLESTRHVRLALTQAGQARAEAGPAAAAGDAPAWFASLIAPKSIEYRRSLQLPGRSAYEVVLRTEPADEVSEAWKDVRGLMGLLLAFSLTAVAVIAWTLSRGLAPVDTVLTVFDRLEQGEDGVRLPAFDLPEWSRLASKFNHMAGVLEHGRGENRRLAQKTLAIQEEERRSLARELHDELGQSIAAIKALAFAQIRRAGEDDSDIKRSAEAIGEISGRLQASVGGMMRQLRPLALDQLGLVPALQHMTDDFNSHHGEMFCRFAVTGAFDDLDEGMKIGIYRIAQESLNNAAKHSGAAAIAIELTRVAEDNHNYLILLIKDDGTGFDPQQVRRGLGLMGMQERSAALGGQFSLQTAPGEGVELRIELPLATIREDQG
jgi:two-component system sensor histidine kinase UhpB